MKIIEKLLNLKYTAKLYIPMSYFFTIIINRWQEDQSQAAVSPGAKSRNEKNRDLQGKKKNKNIFWAVVSR